MDEIWSVSGIGLFFSCYLHVLKTSWALTLQLELITVKSWHNFCVWNSDWKLWMHWWGEMGLGRTQGIQKLPKYFGRQSQFCQPTSIPDTLKNEEKDDLVWLMLTTNLFEENSTVRISFTFNEAIKNPACEACSWILFIQRDGKKSLAHLVTSNGRTFINQLGRTTLGKVPVWNCLLQCCSLDRWCKSETVCKAAMEWITRST